ncbi:MAG: DUF4402 domain-containing protein [Rhodothermales bacterium]
MKNRTLFLVLTLLLAANVSFAQSGSIDANIELQDAPAACTFNTTGSDLDFGGIYKPTGSGTNDAVMDAVTGTLTLQGSGGGSTFGTSQVGNFSLGGTNTSTFTVDITYPATLSSGSGTVPYSGTWAQSTAPASGFALVTGTTYNGTGPGVGPFTHYFRVGGTANGIASATPNGVYTGTVNISGSCN